MIKKTHFIFDVDDTLTDSYVFNQDTFVEGFTPYLDTKKSDVEKYLRELHHNSRGKAMHEQFDEAIKHFSLKIDPIQLVKENDEMHNTRIHKLTVFENVGEMIKMLKKDGKNVSICSNRQVKSLMIVLKKNKLHHHFTNIISCAEEGHHKPDPYCLKKLIKESGEPKANFIYFGDSKTDSEFASSAGIDYVIIDHYLNQKKFYKMLLQAFT